MDPARAPAWQLLHAHAAQALDAHEAAMTAATIQFVAEHPDCLLRSQLSGHLTGSAWVVDATRTRTLLTHHRKLDLWLQLGGHADGDPDLAAVARREAREESGLQRLELVSPAIFDLDRHRIPARKGVPEHWHFDLRFLIEADPMEPLVVSDESHDLAWVDLDRVAALNPEESLARMVRKTLARRRGD
ncbi:MAG: NUDIX hydrolase [Alphaproteobacteria bacterium]|nr:MAG: NUDIX hydrolase [Alphaproteobacteria bacterium]